MTDERLAEIRQRLSGSGDIRSLVSAARELLEHVDTLKAARLATFDRLTAKLLDEHAEVVRLKSELDTLVLEREALLERIDDIGDEMRERDCRRDD